MELYILNIILSHKKKTISATFWMASVLVLELFETNIELKTSEHVAKGVLLKQQS